jgi:hypothetical protein
VLDAAVDAKISVTRNKKTGQTIVKVDESRSGATPKPMAFRIKPFEYAPGKVAGVLDMAEAVKVSDRAFEVLRHMHDYPNDKQKDIVAALPELNDNAVSRAIKELVSNQMLTPKTGRSDLGNITSKGIEYLKTMLGDDFRENEEIVVARLGEWPPVEEEDEAESFTKVLRGKTQQKGKSPVVQGKVNIKITLKLQRLKRTFRGRCS